MILLAHSARKGRREQTYREHICGVTSKTFGNLAELVPYISEERTKSYGAILAPAAAFHDLGKLNSEDQDVLAGRKKAAHLPVEHRDAGVKHLLGDELERPEATLVYAHHWPGLPDLAEQKVSIAPFRFSEAISDSDANLRSYLRMHSQALDRPTDYVEPTRMRLTSLEYRILLSCLVDADYCDTSGECPDVSETRWEERLQKLDQYVDLLPEEDAQQDLGRNRLRSVLYNSCKSASVDSVIEYCDSPVGSGKTTAVMAHMLRTAKEHHLRRIFIVLPYTSIISQTVEVLRKAIVLDGEDPQEIVAEHHHQADFERVELRHLASTWMPRVIVTTAVQFFETLASNQPAKLRKLHQLPGSGIILDEYHASLPIRLMPPAWKWLTELTAQWGCRVCMCSATAVKFWENPIFQKQSQQTALPLIPIDLSTELNSFEQSRIAFNAWGGNVPHFGGMPELAVYLKGFHGSRIVVLNTVQSAAVFAKYLKAHGSDVLHLSSALTPGDREHTIQEIKRRLAPENSYQDDWTLVATSCVECGMNFSFHYGFCELRSLQSYIQLGGRVRRNSEAEYGDASLTAFTIVDDSFSVNHGFSDSMNVFTKMILSKTLSGISPTEAVTRAFRDECKTSGNLSERVCKNDRQKQFCAVAREFRVIDDDTVTVVASQSLAARIRSGEIVSSRDIQRGSVNLRASTCKRLELPDDELPALSELQYDSFLGYMKSLV